MKISARDIDHLSLTLSDPEATASRLLQLGFNLTPEGVEPRCICFQPDQDDVPNYVELLQGDPAVVALALNVAELEGEERTHAWETEDGFEVDAGVVVGESGGPLPWFPVRHETPDAFMEPEWIVHPNGALAMMAIHAVAEDPREVAKALETAWSGQDRGDPRGLHDGEGGLGRTADLVARRLSERIQGARGHGAHRNCRPWSAPPSPSSARGRCRRCCGANNVPFALGEGDRVLVAPEQAGGLMLEFMPQN